MTSLLVNRMSCMQKKLQLNRSGLGRGGCTFYYGFLNNCPQYMGIWATYCMKPITEIIPGLFKSQSFTQRTVGLLMSIAI